MQQKSDLHIFQGMQKDIDVTKHKPELLVDAHNIRITNNGENNSLCITSEKGTIETGVEIKGVILGYCVLNEHIVLFIKDGNNDCIYDVVKKSDGGYYSVNLYNGDLNFDINSTIQTVGHYENELVQKVYWTDGINQPRVINIVSKNIKDKSNTQFDFVRELQLKECVYVQKNTGSNGLFPAGALQYCFTYFDKYGQESNIAWQSQIYFTSQLNRACSPEETVNNSFSIIIENIDTNFDYLRLYSIIRTSIDSTPAVRVVQDISLEQYKSKGSIINFVDDGKKGYTIAPDELLYKGGESIIVGTLNQKDDTLFIGNIKMNNEILTNEDKNKFKNTTLNSDKRFAYILSNGEGQNFYPNNFTLNLYDSVELRKTNGDTISINNLVNPSTFKCGEKYRFGFQMQYKTGKWSEPIFINDYTSTNRPSVSDDLLELPIVKADIDVSEYINKGYKKIRPLVVLPTVADRKIITQGILCPTVYYRENKDDKDIQLSQSSWFFRPFGGNAAYLDTSYIGKIVDGYENRAGNVPTINDTTLSRGEIQCCQGFNVNSCYFVDQKILTMHSADIEFDEDIRNLDFTKVKARVVGFAESTGYAAVNEIENSTPPAKLSGFLKSTIVETSKDKAANTMMAGFYYQDALIDDLESGKYEYWKASASYGSSVNFLVFPWQRNGSINNDVVRSEGERTAVLKYNKFANIKIFNTDYNTEFNIDSSSVILYDYDNAEQIIKINNRIYYGNVDTVVNPKDKYGLIFKLPKDIDSRGNLLGKDIICFSSTGTSWYAIDAETGSYYDSSTSNPPAGFEKLKSIGDIDTSLIGGTNSVRMKYKSTPHIVINASNVLTTPNTGKKGLYIAELYRDNDYDFGGTTDFAIQNNNWIVAGEAVDIKEDGNTQIRWEWGDTYFQRYDCLKTYAYTNEDPNQIIEIGSFMGEFRVNADGRYDANRGQTSNLNMSPINFNLWNEVYNQKNNFFNYRVLDNDYSVNLNFPNQIAFSKAKNSGDIIDNWTNVTLASAVNLNGLNGAITSIHVLGDNLYAFQERALNRLLFNVRTQIPVQDGVPIEISNGQKMEGYQLISHHLGCDNYWKSISAESGIYFIDSFSDDLYFFNGQNTINISETKGMSSWFRNNTKDKVFFDNYNNELNILTNDEVLIYSEGLQAFTSFVEYPNTKFMFNHKDKFIDILNYSTSQSDPKAGVNPYDTSSSYYSSKKSYSTVLHYIHESDTSNMIFNNIPRYKIAFISNADPYINKFFTNVNIRGDWYSVDEAGNTKGIEHDATFGFMKVENEYQTTMADNDNAYDDNNDYNYINSSDYLYPKVRKKFRVWRFDIPRAIREGKDKKDNNRGRDRISNPWCKITFAGMKPFKMHDLDVQYYI